jgi:hypothetical protein
LEQCAELCAGFPHVLCLLCGWEGFLEESISRVVELGNADEFDRHPAGMCVFVHHERSGCAKMLPEKKITPPTTDCNALLGRIPKCVCRIGKDPTKEALARLLCWIFSSGVLTVSNVLSMDIKLYFSAITTSEQTTVIARSPTARIVPNLPTVRFRTRFSRSSNSAMKPFM